MAENGERHGREWLSGTLLSERRMARLSQMEVAEQAAAAGHAARGFAAITQATLSRIERGQRLPKAEHIRSLCALYGTSPELERAMLAAAEDLKPGSYKADKLRRQAAATHRRWLRLEAGAALVRSWPGGTLIPGALQTEGVVRAIFSQDGAVPDEDAVAARLARARRFGEGGREFRMVIPYGALTWRAGSNAVMAGQLAHLADVATRWPGKVRVGVIPAGQDVNWFPTHSFDILSTADPDRAEDATVIFGTWTRTLIISDPQEVAAYIRLFRGLESLSVDGAAAAAVFDGVRAQFYT